MPRKVQDRGLYLRRSSERAGDLLLMEERAVYTVPWIQLCLPFLSPSVYSDVFPFPLPPCVLSLSTLFLPSSSSPVFSSPPHTCLTRLFSSSLMPACLSSSFCRGLLYLTQVFLSLLSLSLDSPGCIQVKLLIASAVGGLRRRLTTAQPVPVQGAAGLRRRGASCSAFDCGCCVLADIAER